MASGGDPFDFFKSSKRSEVSELENELNHNKVERRMDALKKVIIQVVNIICIGHCHDDDRQGCVGLVLPCAEMCRDLEPRA